MTIINHEGELFHYHGREEFKDNNACSFTFCPTDDIRPLGQPCTRAMSPIGDDVWKAPDRRHARREATGPPRAARLTTLFPKPAPTLQLPSQHNIFNEHMKPDLVSSRLRLGPSALRSAVDGGSTSPTRSAKVAGWGGLLLGRDSFASSALSPEVRRLDNSSDMNPSASSFTPAMSASPPSASDLGAINLSLCKALTNERDDHMATKVALSSEITARMEAQNEITRLTMNNKSLITSVQMLGSIIKHMNEEKGQKSEEKEPTSNHPVQENIEKMRQEIYDSQPSEKAPGNSILHDVLQRQREYYETKGYPDSSAGEEVEQPRLSLGHPRVNEKDLFNLDLLRSPELESGSDISTLSRTLRKHFLNASELAEDDKNTNPAGQTSVSNRLIELSPEQVREIKEQKHIGRQHLKNTDSGRAIQKGKKATMDPIREAVAAVVKDTAGQVTFGKNGSTTRKRPLALATVPELGLPQSFLEKYRTPKRANTPSDSTDAEQDPQFSPQVAKKTPVRGRKPAASPHRNPILGNSQQNSTTSPTKNVPEAKPSSSVRARSTTRFGSPVKSPRRGIKIINMPFSTTIYWSIHSNNGVFDDDDDLQDGLTFNHVSVSARDRPTFWDHPIRYMPSLGEKNLYRTVMIDFIPLGTTYRDVLEHVRTGELESIQLYQPVGQSTRFMTARIVFHYELPARNLYVHWQEHGIVINGQKVRVWQVLQATYPKNKQLENDVFNARYTRILSIANLSPEMEDEVPIKLAKQIKDGFVIEIGRTHDDLCRVEFTSVAEMAKAIRAFSADRKFAGIELDCEDDPCDQAYNYGTPSI